jgi:DNA-binding NarL/FixJ family response regulator
VVFLTAGKRKELWAIAEEVEPAGFFEKPYEPAELLQSIKNILAGRQNLTAETNLA